MAKRASPRKASPSKASVKFHLGVYKEAAVRKAAQEYGDLAAFSFSKAGGYLTVTASPKGGSLPEGMMDELANLAIFNSI